MIITPSSELDAVNEILTAVGNSPTNSLDTDEDIDVINAKRVLKGVSREIQAKGFFFNQESNVYLKPEVTTKRVPCPESYIKFYSRGVQYIRRDGYFFDVSTRNDVFPDGITVNLIRELKFVELPEAFRRYITARSARIFQERFLSSPELAQGLMQAEAEAYSEVVDYELLTGNYNVFRDDPFVSQNIQRS